MKLENLKQTTLLCIEHHKLQGNETKVAQLYEGLKRVEEKQFDNETQYNGLYMGQEKESFGEQEEKT
jgi:hypothetical protein